MSEPRYVITGATGFIGGHLIRSLSERKEPALLLSRRPPASLPGGFTWIRWEAGSPTTLASLAPTACVIHLAAHHHVEHPTPAQDQLCAAINFNGTRQLLADCSAAGLRRFIYFSTIKAAPPAADSRPRRESDPEEIPPNTAYGRSKLAAENAVRAWAAESPDRSALILRPAVVYGPQSVANIYLLMRAIARRRFLLAGTNDNIKSVVSVRNLVAATLFLAQRQKSGTDSYYLIDRDNYSVREFAALISTSLGINRRIPTLPIPVLRPIAVFGDALARTTGIQFPLTTRRLNALLEHSAFTAEKLCRTGFDHPQSTREGLEEMAAWIRTQSPAPPTPSK